MDPGSVIGGCPEPMPFMGTIPIATIKQDFCTDIRGDVYISSGYNGHWRRRWDYDRRGSTDAYVEVRCADFNIDSRD
jgi:hypothetical protein